MALFPIFLIFYVLGHRFEATSMKIIGNDENHTCITLSLTVVIRLFAQIRSLFMFKHPEKCNKLVVVSADCCIFQDASTGLKSADSEGKLRVYVDACVRNT